MKLSFKGWQFLLISGVILLAVLAFSASYEARQAEIQDLKTEKDLQLQQLQDLKEQLNEAAERLEELETMLLNLHRMERIVTGSAISSRGGRITLTTMPLTTPSGFTAERLEMALAGTALAGLGQAFYGAEKACGINAVILAAICAYESGWGTSKLAREKGNLAGLGAYDGAEYSSGITFASRAESVMYLAQLLATHYAPGGKYFGGSHDLQGIGARYASDPRWAEKVAERMKIIAENAKTWR